jgi:hypothetical protein
MRRSRKLARPKRLAIVALAALSVTALVAVPDYTEARSRFSRGIIGVATAPVRTVMRAVPGFSGSRFGNRRAARAYARAPSRGAAVATTTAAGVASAARPNAEDTDPSRVPQGARPAAAGNTQSVNTQSFNAYEDLIGYALWPQDYATRFWSRGYGDLMKSMVSAAVSPGMCAGETDEQAAKPVERLTQAIELTEPQRARLAELRSALGEAVARGKAACRDAMPAAPSARLKLSADGLWAMRDADILLRTPLVNFYATLSDAQKAQLGNTAAELPCNLAANDLPVGAIEQSVRPTEAQRASLEMMKGFSTEMSGYLASSCPNEAPADPVGRLDAAGNRVSALLYAVMLFDQALNGFYSGLSDDQKKRFDGVRR